MITLKCLVLHRMVGSRLAAERAPECGQTQWRFCHPLVPGKDALGVMGKGFIPHQVDAKMDYMNIEQHPLQENMTENPCTVILSTMDTTHNI